MVTLEQLMQDAEVYGARFLLVEGKIRCEAPPGFITPERQEFVRLHKEALKNYLRMSDTLPPSTVTIEPPSNVEAQLRAGNSLLFVRCRHLDGEEVVFAPDAAAILLDTDGRYQGRVIYRVHELERLSKASPSLEALRTIHAVKKEFGGEYYGTDFPTARGSGAAELA